MNEHRASITIGSEAPAKSCRVKHSMLLHEVAEQVDLDRFRYLLVESSEGRLMGVIETTALLQRIATWNPNERHRWYNMPVEASLAARLDLPDVDGQKGMALNPGRPLTCDGSAVAEGDHLQALFLGDELLIRWSAVKRALEEALVDPITSLPNRSVFDRKLREEWNRAERMRHSICIVLFDIDHFKDVNDVYGHAVGDAVLSEVGTLLRRHLRSYDLLARYGGDEFAAVLLGCRPGEIDIPIQRLMHGFQAAQAGGNTASPNYSLSIGAAVLHDLDAVPMAEELVDKADACLYEAKRAGRGCAFKCEIFDSDSAAQDAVEVALSSCHTMH